MARQAQVILSFDGVDISSATEDGHTHSSSEPMGSAGGHGHDASTNIGEAGEHAHEARCEYWMPQINDQVVVLHLPGFNTDGYILGVIM